MNLVQLLMREPGPGQVRLRVEACGVCHSDAGTVEGLFPIDWPRVPGHELVGRIDALGSGVQGWAVGQRVGVGVSRRRLRLLRFLPQWRHSELP
jgi:propanol-preferring alcohol dehydrogenase